MPAVLKVGLCGVSMSLAKYPSLFPVLEVQQTFYQPPTATVMDRWRATVPASFELTVKAWQLITHSAVTSSTYRRLRRPLTEQERRETGGFRASAIVDEGWRVTVECAQRLRATAILFQCPASFKPTDANVEAMRGFFTRITRPANVRLMWEPRGPWPVELVQRVCTELDLVHVVDPFVNREWQVALRAARSPAEGRGEGQSMRGPTYWRLHGITGARHVYTDAELLRLREMVPTEGDVYVMFNNMPRVEDAQRFVRLCAGTATAPTARMPEDKLSTYQAMRDFAQTSEPASGDPSATGSSYVIQKHAASHLHYDFRLELDGVLLSWSVPKGPSLAPKTRRLAVRTEDHPVGYGTFEGTIPQGQYGGGTVAVWDHGTWKPEGDAREMLAKGKLAFTLAGDKLRGKWHLVRTQPRAKRESWLLFKGRDDEADDETDIVAKLPDSAVSGRSIEQIASGAATKKPKPKARAKPAKVAPTSLDLPFRLTSLDRVVYPDAGVTKGDVITYLTAVADRMLPHVVDRPLTIVRCPGGQGKKCFYQKKIMSGVPDAIAPIEITEADGDVAEYMQVSDVNGVIALAQHGTLELHTWGSRSDNVEKPDIAVFDFDPDVGLPFERVTVAALAMRDRLKKLGLRSFVKTTGGKGLHVVVPMQRRLDWDQFRDFSQLVAEAMEQAEPSAYTTTVAKAARKGKILIDYLRNARGSTFVAPYSPRARPGAPVAMPVSWAEVEAGVDPAAFTIATVASRLAAPDPWKDFFKVKQGITAAQLRALRKST